MGKVCFFKELPLHCQQCDKLQAVYYDMSGKHHWECTAKNINMRREFSSGKSCVDGVEENEPSV